MHEKLSEYTTMINLLIIVISISRHARILNKISLLFWRIFILLTYHKHIFF